MSGAELIPGAVDALRRFRSQGVGLALITNGTRAAQRGKLERFDLERHFDHIFIEEETGFGKPEQEVYLTAMAALGSKPADTWCVGDNLRVGGRGATAAGNLQRMGRSDW